MFLEQWQIIIIVFICFVGGMFIGILSCIDYIKFYKSYMRLKKETQKGKDIDEYMNRKMEDVKLNPSHSVFNDSEKK